MSRADAPMLRPARRFRDTALLSLGVFAGIVAALLPVFSVIAPGTWTAGAITAAAAVLASGLAMRFFALPAIAATVLEVVVAVVLLTAMFGRSTALLGVIPTPATIASVPGLFAAASEEIRLGVAPVVPGTGLSFVLVGAIAGLAIVLDHVVLTARMPLLGGVGLVAVSLIPTIAIPADVNVPAVLALAAAILFLLRMDTRARTRAVGSSGRRLGPRVWGASSTAIGIAAVAVVVTVVAVPSSPSPDCASPRGAVPGSGRRSIPTSSWEATCANRERSTCCRSPRRHRRRRTCGRSRCRGSTGPCGSRTRATPSRSPATYPCSIRCRWTATSPWPTGPRRSPSASSTAPGCPFPIPPRR